MNESGLFEKHGTILRVKPDGTSTLIETINAVAEVDLTMRKYPFDTQRLEAVFEVFGFDSSEVVFEAVPLQATSGPNAPRISQWEITRIENLTREQGVSYAGETRKASRFVLSIDVARESLFTMRLIVVPLMIIVALSWSVFWMDRSSLGDRISVSFIGILTAVAYQVVVGDTLPHISYVTWMNGFLNISFVVMCATVIINLIVGACDKNGRSEIGDRIDRNCRWVFPTVYFGWLSIILAIALILY